MPAGLQNLWREFNKLPQERALAIAGDTGGLWVAGATGGHATSEAAERSALEECARRRAQRRIQASCRIFAVGNRIVDGRR